MMGGKKEAALNANSRALLRLISPWNAHPDMKAMAMLTVAYGLLAALYGPAGARVRVTAFLNSISAGGDNDAG